MTVRLAHYKAAAILWICTSGCPPKLAWAGRRDTVGNSILLSPREREEISLTLKARQPQKIPARAELGRGTLQHFEIGTRTYISAYRKPSVLPT